MKSRFIASLGALFAVVLSVGPAAPALAANLTIHGSECQLSGQTQHDDVFQSSIFGVVQNPVSLSGKARWVVCSLPHSPLPPTASARGFWIDGFNSKNNFDAKTNCYMRH